MLSYRNKPTSNTSIPHSASVYAIEFTYSGQQFIYLPSYIYIVRTLSCKKFQKKRTLSCTVYAVEWSLGKYFFGKPSEPNSTYVDIQVVNRDISYNFNQWLSQLIIMAWSPNNSMFISKCPGLSYANNKMLLICDEARLFGQYGRTAKCQIQQSFIDYSTLEAMKRVAQEM